MASRDNKTEELLFWNWIKQKLLEMSLIECNFKINSYDFFSWNKIPSSIRWSNHNWCDNLVSCWRRPFIKWCPGKRLKFSTFLMFFSSKSIQVPFMIRSVWLHDVWKRRIVISGRCTVESWLDAFTTSFEVPKCFYFLSCFLDSLPKASYTEFLWCFPVQSSTHSARSFSSLFLLLLVAEIFKLSM